MYSKMLWVYKVALNSFLVMVSQWRRE